MRDEKTDNFNEILIRQNFLTWANIKKPESYFSSEFIQSSSKKLAEDYEQIATNIHKLGNSAFDNQMILYYNYRLPNVLLNWRAFFTGKSNPVQLPLLDDEIISFVTKLPYWARNNKSLFKETLISHFPAFFKKIERAKKSNNYNWEKIVKNNIKIIEKINSEKSILDQYISPFAVKILMNEKTVNRNLFYKILKQINRKLKIPFVLKSIFFVPNYILILRILVVKTFLKEFEKHKIQPDNNRMSNLQQNILLGLPIHTISKKELLSEIENRLIHKTKTIIYGLCVGSLSRLKNKKENLPYYLNQMDIIVPDGSAIPLLGKFFNVPVKEVIPITELSLDIIRIANEKNLTVFLFGASEEMNRQAVQNLRVQFPNAHIPDGINGYYIKEQETEILAKINSEKPDILLIGMTYPLKEEFSVRFKNELYSSIIVPCGGAIDVFAGKTKRPPRIIKKLMLTWLYRWIQEPKRLKIKDDFRFLLITFPLLLIKHYLGIEKNPSLIKHYKLQK